MRSENAGNKISKVKYLKNKVNVTLINKEKLEIPLDIFSSHYLYVGKILSDKELNEIKEEIKNYDLYKYARNLLTTRRYSEFKIREKLYLKEASKEEVDKIIRKLKEAHLIDDKSFAIDYIEASNEKRYGKNKIKAKLKEKGIFSENIDDSYFSDKDEFNKAKSWLPSLEKRYEKYPYQAKKDHVISFLINQGFDLDIAIKVANEIKPSSTKDEMKLLRKDYDKLYAQYKRKYEGRELKDKLYQALRRKGYKSNNIMIVMEENEI